MRRFEVGQMNASKFDKLDVCYLLAVSEHDESVWRFAPTLVWQANNRYFLDRRVAQEHTFNFDGGNIFAAADNHILQAISNFDIPVRVNHRGVSRMKPTIAKGLR